ncbi:MAG: DNA recombination protein RmuC [Phycisphaera sp.]|nr:DNA recombination protein RmuC [Phycisphaera sp.]
MTNTLLIINLVVTVLLAVMVVVLLLRRGGGGGAGDDAAAQAEQTAAAMAQIQQDVETIRKEQDRAERNLRDEFTRNREEANKNALEARKELGETVVKQMAAFGEFQTKQLDQFSKELKELRLSTETMLDRIRKTVDERLKELQEHNSKKLDEMRATVDEKLQTTLEKRLGESFKQVSERLEKVHQGLGEMQTLANGVGDLKRVMTNVKVRGTWGEVLLGSLLEQVLTADQYEKNCKVRPRSDVVVEYAVKLPGPEEDAGSCVYLPIDAKFPKEAYERIVAASEAADPVALEAAERELETAVMSFARDIRDKYIAPPHTTDFAILFVPTEGLYAELLRRPGLVDRLQRDCRVNLAGPTTLLSLLNSLQMGFRTLAIQKRSGEVWKLLGAVKTEFGRFEDWIAAVQKKLHSASKEMDRAATRTKQIHRRLSKVQEMPSGEVSALLGESESNGDDAGSNGAAEEDA